GRTLCRCRGQANGDPCHESMLVACHRLGSARQRRGLAGRGWHRLAVAITRRCGGIRGELSPTALLASCVPGYRSSRHRVPCRCGGYANWAVGPWHGRRDQRAARVGPLSRVWAVPCPWVPRHLSWHGPELQGGRTGGFDCPRTPPCRLVVPLAVIESRLGFALALTARRRARRHRQHFRGALAVVVLERRQSSNLCRNNGPRS